MRETELNFTETKGCRVVKSWDEENHKPSVPPNCPNPRKSKLPHIFMTEGSLVARYPLKVGSNPCTNSERWGHYLP